MKIILAVTLLTVRASSHVSFTIVSANGGSKNASFCMKRGK